MKKLIAIVSVLILLSPMAVFAHWGGWGGNSASGGGGGGAHDLLTGVTSSQHHPESPAALHFDCIVGATGEYATINAAWASSCYKMFVQDGSYTWTADMELDDPSESVWLVGESKEGVVIDTAGYSLRPGDSNRPLPTPAGTITTAVGSDVVTGISTEFSTWGLTAGDIFCPSGSMSNNMCYEIATVDTELQLTLTEDVIQPVTGASIAADSMLGQAYLDFIFLNFTLVNVTDEFMEQRLSGDTDHRGFIWGLIAENIDAGDTTNTANMFYQGWGRDWYFSRLSSRTSIPSASPGAVALGVKTVDGTGAGNQTAFLGSTLGALSVTADEDVRIIGNMLGGNGAGGYDFSAVTGSAIIGNTAPEGVALIETLFDSLNLPGRLYVGGEVVLQYDATQNNLSLGGVDGQEDNPTTDNIIAGTGASGASQSNWVNGNNIIAGTDTMSTNADVDGIVAIGSFIGDAITAGANANNSVLVGENAVGSANSLSTTVAVGYGAGGGTGPVAVSGSVFLGNEAGPSTPGLISDKLYIDNSATDDPLIYGDFDIDALTFNGTVEVIDELTATGGATIGGVSSAITFTETNATIDGWTGYLTLEDGFVVVGDDTTNDTMDGDGDLLVEDELEVNGLIHQSVTAGITADSGSIQGGSPITTQIAEISVCGTIGDAVTLPPALAGIEIKIINHGANSADVFPATDDAINEAAADTAKALAADASMTCMAYDAVNWECLTLAR